VDGQGFEQIDSYGSEQWLGELVEELRNKTYQPKAVRRVIIPKPNALMGFRLGEVLAMRAKHIDRGRLLYHVVEAYKCQSFRKPKGGKSRFVDIPESLAAELEEHVMTLKKEGLQAGRGGHVDFLFVKPGGSEGSRWPFSQRDVQCELRRVCKAAGLEVRNPRDLRHTYATTLLMAGMSPDSVPQLQKSAKKSMKGSSNLLEPFIILNRWCPRPDLNRHGSPHYPLKIACLPGSTTWAKGLRFMSGLLGLGRRVGFGFRRNRSRWGVRSFGLDGGRNFGDDRTRRPLAGQISQRKRRQHEYDGCHGCRLAQKGGRSAGAEKGVAGASPKSRADIGSFSRLQKHDHDQRDAHHNMNDYQ